MWRKRAAFKGFCAPHRNGRWETEIRLQNPLINQSEIEVCSRTARITNHFPPLAPATVLNCSCETTMMSNNERITSLLTFSIYDSGWASHTGRPYVCQPPAGWLETRRRILPLGLITLCVSNQVSWSRIKTVQLHDQVRGWNNRIAKNDNE